MLVRHGQTAGFFHGPYTALTPLGREQAAAVELPADIVFVGPRERHQETLACARGPQWPEARVVQALDEHHGKVVMPRAVPLLAARGSERALAGVSGTLQGRERLRLVKEVMDAWVRGDLAQELADIESFQAFRARVGDWLRTLLSDCPRSSTVVAVTSGGTVAAALGHVLGLSDDQVLELSYLVLNTSITELRFSAERGYTLFSFNTTPHLRADQRTLV